MIVNGKVYIASFSNKLQVYGLLPNAAPPTPANVVAYGQDSAVSLYWDDAPRTSTYNILRSVTSGGPYTTLTTGVVAHSYTDTPAANGTKYYYRVVAVNPYGTAQSAEVNAVPNTAVVGSGDGLFASYYSGGNGDWTSETGTPFLTRVDATVNFSVDNGTLAFNPTAFPTGVPHDNYTGVWTGKFLAPYTGPYSVPDQYR